MLLLKYLFYFSEPRQKVPAFNLKIMSPAKRGYDGFQQSKSHRLFFESGGDGTSKSTMGNTSKILESKPMDPKVKNYVNLEWSLVYVEEDGVLFLIFAKSEGKEKMDLGKSFTYGRLRNVEYEDNDSPNLVLDVESLNGTRRVLIDEGNLVAECQKPKRLINHLIELFSNPNDWVLDLFSGTGI